jgi:hypothetical protein
MNFRYSTIYRFFSSIQVWLLTLTSASLLFLTACSTGSQPTSSHKNWNSRVGNYTYDQAVAELGPPKSTQVKPDGTRVAEWLAQKGRPGSVGFGMDAGQATPGRRESQVPYETPRVPDQYLRLTFGSDGTLQSWRQSAK